MMFSRFVVGIPTRGAIATVFVYFANKQNNQAKNFPSFVVSGAMRPRRDILHPGAERQGTRGQKLVYPCMPLFRKRQCRLRAAHFGALPSPRYRFPPARSVHKRPVLHVTDHRRRTFAFHVQYLEIFDVLRKMARFQ